MEFSYDSELEECFPMPTRQRVAPKIDSFRGKNFFLSNFYKAPFVMDGITFSNAEAAFQSMKCRGTEQQKLFGADGPYGEPKEAKRAGGRHGVVKLPDDWESIKDGCMKEVLFRKFAQNPKLAEALLDTGNSVLIEGNAWGDTYWGQSNGHGLNKLGFLLMDLRHEIATEWLK